MLLIKNAHILTMAERDYDKGDILIEGGKFVEISEHIERDCEIFNAKGLTAIPGIVDAHCHIGMWEDGIDSEGADGNECTDPITPELRAIDGINPFDRCFEEARKGGVTTVVTGPGSANVLGGQFIAMKTAGNNIDEMCIKNPCALKAALGENPKTVYGEQKKMPSTRMATVALLRKALIDAAHYNGELFGEKPTKRDLQNEILALALDGEVPVKFHAHRADDIMTAVRIAREFNINITLDHCTEGYLIPDFLKSSGAKIILGPLMCDRCKPELKNLSWDAPRILHEHGIEFALMSDHPVGLTQNLPVFAAMAVRHGLPAKTALLSITLHAARAAFIDDRVGSTEPGKDADIAFFAGDPLDVRTRVEAVFISGKRI